MDLAHFLILTRISVLHMIMVIVRHALVCRLDLLSLHFLFLLGGCQVEQEIEMVYN